MSKTLFVFYKALAVGMGAVGAFCFTFPAKAALMYVESLDGDLSSDHNTPTLLGKLMSGDNFLEAAINNPEMGTQDRDYFTITVPRGLQLEHIFLENYQTGFAGDDVGFIGIEQGDQITPAPPTNLQEQEQAAAQLLGYTLFGTRTVYDNTVACNNLGVVGQPLEPNTIVLVGQDLLPVLGIANKPPLLTNCNLSFPTTGFTPPLAGNTNYSFWVQQTAGTGETQYTLRFAVSATIPEPAFTLGLVTFATLVISRKRKTRA